MSKIYRTCYGCYNKTDVMDFWTSTVCDHILCRKCVLKFRSKVCRVCKKTIDTWYSFDGRTKVYNKVNMESIKLWGQIIIGDDKLNEHVLNVIRQTDDDEPGPSNAISMPGPSNAIDADARPGPSNAIDADVRSDAKIYRTCYVCYNKTFVMDFWTPTVCNHKLCENCVRKLYINVDNEDSLINCCVCRKCIFEWFYYDDTNYSKTTLQYYKNDVLIDVLITKQVIVDEIEINSHITDVILQTKEREDINAIPIARPGPSNAIPIARPGPSNAIPMPGPADARPGPSNAIDADAEEETDSDEELLGNMSESLTTIATLPKKRYRKCDLLKFLEIQQNSISIYCNIIKKLKKQNIKLRKKN
nr:hypothetical protein Datr000024 [Darna trima granulovirus]